MADLVKNTDYIGQGLGRLLQLFKGRPRIAALLTSYLTQVQELEDALYDVYFFRVLMNNPTGDLLDKIGKKVGQPRQGLSDVSYLKTIPARIRANRSAGRRDDFYDILILLFGNDGSFSYIVETLPPRSVYVQVGLDVTIYFTALFLFNWFFKPPRTTAAGVRINFVAGLSGNTLIFGSTVGGSINPTADNSPGSTNDPGQGGVFAGGYGA